MCVTVCVFVWLAVILFADIHNANNRGHRYVSHIRISCKGCIETSSLDLHSNTNQIIILWLRYEKGSYVACTHKKTHATLGTHCTDIMDKKVTISRMSLCASVVCTLYGVVWHPGQGRTKGRTTMSFWLVIFSMQMVCIRRQ